MRKLVQVNCKIVGKCLGEHNAMQKTQHWSVIFIKWVYIMYFIQPINVHVMPPL